MAACDVAEEGEHAGALAPARCCRLSLSAARLASSATAGAPLLCYARHEDIGLQLARSRRAILRNTWSANATSFLQHSRLLDSMHQMKSPIVLIPLATHTRTHILSACLSLSRRLLTLFKYIMRQSIVYALGMLALAISAEEEKPPPFNKAELEEMLKKEHSQKIANIYDSETSTQCAAKPNAATRSLLLQQALWRAFRLLSIRSAS